MRGRLAHEQVLHIPPAPSSIPECQRHPVLLVQVRAALSLPRPRPGAACNLQLLCSNKKWRYLNGEHCWRARLSSRHVHEPHQCGYQHTLHNRSNERAWLTWITSVDMKLDS